MSCIYNIQYIHYPPLDFWPDSWYKENIKKVREGAVSQIMAETSDLHAEYVFVRYIELRLFSLQYLHQLTGQESNTRSAYECECECMCCSLSLSLSLALSLTRLNVQIGCVPLLGTPSSIPRAV